MIFKEMDPDEVRKALEGHHNAIADEVKKHEDYFASLSCSYCQGSVHPFISPEKLFEENSFLPKYLAECDLCGHQFEPYTKIELRGPQRDPLGRDEAKSIVDPRFDLSDVQGQD
jgi:hypothetical protein